MLKFYIYLQIINYEVNYYIDVNMLDIIGYAIDPHSQGKQKIKGIVAVHPIYSLMVNFGAG